MGGYGKTAVAFSLKLRRLTIINNNIYTINHTAQGSSLHAKVIAKDILEAKEKYENNQAFECEVRKGKDLRNDVFEIKKEKR